jgi:hypothetical protein
MHTYVVKQILQNVNCGIQDIYIICLILEMFLLVRIIFIIKIFIKVK